MTQEKPEKITLERVNTSDYLTIEEAATELGMKPSVIRNYLVSGRFTKYKFKTLTLVSAKEVRKYKQKQKPR